MVFFFFLAALFFALAPFYIPALAPLIFLYPLFLFYLLQSSWSLSICWSFCVSFFESAPIGDALIYLAPEHTYLSLIPYFLLITYTTFSAILWLGTTHAFMTRRSFIMQRSIWLVSLWGYLLFKDQAQFIIFGFWEGNLFSNPLLPLCHYPSLTALFCKIPEWLALGAFSLIASLILVLFSYPRLVPFFIPALLAPLLIPSFPAKAPPYWLSSIGHLPIMIPDTSHPELSAAIIRHELISLKEKFPTLTTVFLPESAWNGTQLSTISSLAALQHCPIPNIIIGSFSEDHNHCYNTVYLYCDGKRIHTTSKRHALPLAERFIALPLCASLYFQKSQPISSWPSPKSPFTLENPALTGVIYICSELFFNTVPDDPYSCLIIALVSDWWFRSPHFCRLMAYAARLRALQWQRPILYISYKYAFYCDTQGTFYSLVTHQPSCSFH